LQPSIIYFLVIFFAMICYIIKDFAKINLFNIKNTIAKQVHFIIN